MTPTRWRTSIAAASLIVGPALMSLGDLWHPAESHDPVAQVAIVAESATRWHSAHLLLFLGLLLLVPGLLALTRLATQRRPVMGHLARILLLASVGAMSAVFVFEMLLGRFVAGGGELTVAVSLIETFQSPKVFLALVPGLLAFFVGTALFVAPLASVSDPFRWPALGFALGATLILGEILLAEVLLSQIGNVVILLSCSAFARLLLRSREPLV